MVCDQHGQDGRLSKLAGHFFIHINAYFDFVVGGVVDTVLVVVHGEDDDYERCCH